jgi:D-hydroxyproline dehydrogenase subunit gamma
MPKHGYRINSGAHINRGQEVKFILDGKEVKAFEGETVATAMMAEDKVAMRTTTGGEPRGVYCGMGVCFDCLVVVNGIANTRACMTWVKEGMQVSTQEGLKAKGAS